MPNSAGGSTRASSTGSPAASTRLTTSENVRLPARPRLRGVDNRELALTTRPWKYPDELRERAVREVRTSGRPFSHAVRDLGIHKEALWQWASRPRPTRASGPTC
ncbi:transposase [Streptomyces sp. NPDC002935]|uniref:transposase n=1 Tax=unclassified Streptomyces TaxID=2593676 RepID=UPI0033287F39